MSASLLCIGRQLTYVHPRIEAIDAAIDSDMAEWGTRVLERARPVQRPTGEWAVTVRFDRLD